MSNKHQVSHEDALTLARQHHQAGNLTLAERTYRDILNIIPNDFNSLHYLSIVLYQKGNIEEAIEFIKKAIDEKDDFAESWNAYAVMLAQLGNNEEAIEKWKKAIKLKSDFPEALSNLGNTYWELKRFEESVTVCEEAISINPDYADGYINLGNAYTGIGDPEKAVKTWKKSIELNAHNPNAYINIGNALRDLGKIRESEEYCEQAVKLAPNHPKALLNLANAKRDLGNFSEAEALYRQATQANPSYIDAHNNLAIVLMDLLQFDEAITSIKFALALDNNQAQAYTNLAAALRETGQLKEAEEAARKALILNPDETEARIDLADILFMSDQLEEAETIFNDVMELVPDSPRLYLKLSAVLERSNRMEEALECVDKAVAITPEMPEVYHRKALIYFMSNYISEALEALDKALDIKPNFPAALATKSEILQTHGDMKQAGIVAREGLKINADIPFLYFTLSKVKKFTSDDPDLLKMKELAKDVNKFGRVQAVALHFALFKAHEDIGDYESAFEYLKIGNDLKRSSVVFDRNQQNMSFEKVKDVYTAEFVESFKNKGCKDDTPIFIVGMPRSGTTLTEQIISSHPDVFGAGELHFLSSVEQELGFVNQENCKKLGQHYVDYAKNIDKDSKTARFITDKMPGNYMRVGQILATLPNAKIIHCKRNPIDTCLSCYKQLFARGHYWSYSMDEMAEHYALYIDMMNHWRETFPDSFFEINYEETVGDFENQARKLINYVGLEWNDACLEPHKQKRSILTASKGQVRKPIYKTSVEAWKRYEEQLQPLAKPLLQFVEK